VTAEPVPFSVAFEHEHAFGYVVGVWLPQDRRPVPDEALQRLDRGEADHAARLAGYRQCEWVGGRLAARVAGGHFGHTSWAVGTGPLGEPRAPHGMVLSIAHKRGLAIALVSNDASTAIGVDLEDDAVAAMRVEEIVFSAEELQSLAAMQDSERGGARVLGFALKEAVYKACAVSFGRPLAYLDARVSWQGPRDATVALTASDPPTMLDVAIEWRGAQVIAAVRARGRSPRRSPSNSER